MKKTYLTLLIVCAFLFPNTTSYSQPDWLSMSRDPGANFFEVQKSFNLYVEKYKADYRKARGAEPDRVPGYKQFKRWEWFMAPRVSETGEFFAPDAVWKAMEEYNASNTLANAGNWTSLGPNSVAGLLGAGRINFVRVSPSNPNVIFVGAASGGLWKSTDGGSTWATTTDWVAQVIGCSDLAFDPNNSNIMYLVTGDADGYFNYSVGLLKSIDGGTTWSTTGLNYLTMSYKFVNRVLTHPTNSNIILVATREGIFRSTNAGASFTKTLISTNGIKDMEFKPGDPNTVYCSGMEFYKSINNGATWTMITSGLPASATLCRMAIAVTPNDPAVVYLIAGLAGPGYGTDGFYRSTNSGAGFTKRSTPALGNQQWFDLCVAASPGNKDEVLLGGQTEFLKSSDGGATWGVTGANTHVDYHDIIYTNSTTAYVTSDGGVWKSPDNGGTWIDLSKGMAIAQMYGFGQSSTDPNLYIQGWQDNGTNRFNGTWSSVIGGDGMMAFISWNNDQNMWGSTQNGGLRKSNNGGATFTSCKGNITGGGAWVTPWIEDPVTANTIYAGFNDVWKHTSGGGATGWTKISSIGTVTITAIAVSPANNQVIWCTNGDKLYKTSNGGTSWSTITGLPDGTIAEIACSYGDANKAWVCYSGFAQKNKIFQTNDQGVSWINLSPSLPNIPVNCITVDKNGNDALYIGTDAGVYYKDATLSVWQPFSTNLPNVIISQLQIFYSGSKIRAATFGRGLWESPLFQSGTSVPLANFSADKKFACPGVAVNFSDYSSGQPTSWNWSFPGGTPSSSTLQNPVVVYNTAGTYTVSLQATNANGNDSEVRNNYVTITSSSFAAPSTTGASRCSTGVVTLTATGSGLGTLRWWNAPGSGSTVNTGASYSPNLTATTTFYVDEVFPNYPDDIVGAGDYTIGAGKMFPDNDVRGLYFDVLAPIKMKSFNVYANVAGNRTFEILDPQGVLIADTTIFVPSSPTTPFVVNVNFTLYPGTQYFIKCRGLVDLYRNNTGAAYPYTSSALNITESNAGIPGYYYYFYNIVYTPLSCNTPRTAVTGTVNCVGINEEIEGGILNISPNPSNGKFDVSFQVNTRGNYMVKISNTLGQTVYHEKMNNFSGAYEKKIDISSYGKGVYMLSLTNTKNETVKRMVVY